jgi:pullulanase
MKDRELIEKHIEFFESPKNTVMFMLKDYANYDSFKDIIIIYNANNNTVKLNLPEGNWYLYIDKNNIYDTPHKSFQLSIEIQPLSLTILSNTIL